MASRAMSTGLKATALAAVGGGMWWIFLGEPRIGLLCNVVPYDETGKPLSAVSSWEYLLLTARVQRAFHRSASSAEQLEYTHFGWSRSPALASKFVDGGGLRILLSELHTGMNVAARQGELTKMDQPTELGTAFETNATNCVLVDALARVVHLVPSAVNALSPQHWLDLLDLTDTTRDQHDESLSSRLAALWETIDLATKRLHDAPHGAGAAPPLFVPLGLQAPVLPARRARAHTSEPVGVSLADSRYAVEPHVAAATRLAFLPRSVQGGGTFSSLAMLGQQALLAAYTSPRAHAQVGGIVSQLLPALANQLRTQTAGGDALAPARTAQLHLFATVASAAAAKCPTTGTPPQLGMLLQTLVMEGLLQMRFDASSPSAAEARVLGFQLLSAAASLSDATYMLNGRTAVADHHSHHVAADTVVQFQPSGGAPSRRTAASAGFAGASMSDSDLAAVLSHISYIMPTIHAALLVSSSPLSDASAASLPGASAGTSSSHGPPTAVARSAAVPLLAGALRSLLRWQDRDTALVQCMYQPTVQHLTLQGEDGEPHLELSSGTLQEWLCRCRNSLYAGISPFAPTVLWPPVRHLPRAFDTNASTYGDGTATAMLFEDELGLPTSASSGVTEQAALVNPSTRAANALYAQFRDTLDMKYVGKHSELDVCRHVGIDDATETTTSRKHVAGVGQMHEVACLPSLVDILLTRVRQQESPSPDAQSAAEVLQELLPPDATGDCTTEANGVLVALRHQLAHKWLLSSLHGAMQALAGNEPYRAALAKEHLRWYPRHSSAARQGKHTAHAGSHLASDNNTTSVSHVDPTSPGAIALEIVPPYVARRALHNLRHEASVGRLPPLLLSLYDPPAHPSPPFDIHVMKALAFCASLPTPPTATHNNNRPSSSSQVEGEASELLRTYMARDTTLYPLQYLASWYANQLSETRNLRSESGDFSAPTGKLFAPAMLSRSQQDSVAVLRQVMRCLANTAFSIAGSVEHPQARPAAAASDASRASTEQVPHTAPATTNGRFLERNWRVGADILNNTAVARVCLSTGDIKLRCQAARAWSNVAVLQQITGTAAPPSSARGQSPIYGDMLFPAYETAPGATASGSHDSSSPVVDVILVHGLQGAALKTWRAPAVDPLTAPTPLVPRNGSSETSISTDMELNTTAGQGLELFDSETQPTHAAKTLNAAPFQQSVHSAVSSDHTQYVVKFGQRMALWPVYWLVRDLEGRGLRCRVIAVAYDADMWAASSIRPHMSLPDIGAQAASQLLAAGVGRPDRMTVFLAHSLGGLVTKSILTSDAAIQRHETGDTALGDSLGVVAFYGVPHFGNKAAEYAVAQLSRVHKWIKRSLTTPHITALGSTSDLVSLNDAFKATVLAAEVPPQQIVNIAEGKATSIPAAVLHQTTLTRGTYVIVPPETANPGIGTFDVIAGADHMQICKPEGYGDPRYAIARNAILRAVAHWQEIHKPEGS